jgi:hypothetical protein
VKLLKFNLHEKIKSLLDYSFKHSTRAMNFHAYPTAKNNLLSSGVKPPQAAHSPLGIASY